MLQKLECVGAQIKQYFLYLLYLGAVFSFWAEFVSGCDFHTSPDLRTGLV